MSREAMNVNQKAPTSKPARRSEKPSCVRYVDDQDPIAPSIGPYSKNARLTNHRTGLLRTLLESARSGVWRNASLGVMVTAKAGTRQMTASKLRARRIANRRRNN